jgi:hypothetical protein
MVLTVQKPQLGGSENEWGSIINTALDEIVLEINSNADGTNTVTPNLGSGWEVGGVAVTSTAAELNILDGVTATAAELNTLDGDTAATSTTVVDADRVVFNDAGTMKQVAMSDLKTYINASVGSGSVTSVAMSVPTGLSISGSPITTSGTLAVSLQSGYSIPTTSSQSNWNTAYGWGDHSSQGYLTSGSLSSYATTSQAFGISQTWQTTSISVQTWYQNSSSKAELWHVRQGSGQAGTVRVGTSTSSYVTLDMRDGDSGEFIPIYFVVPPSHYFYVNGSSFASQFKLA